MDVKYIKPAKVLNKSKYTFMHLAYENEYNSASGT